MLQLCQKRLHIFLDLLSLKGIAVKAAIGAAQIAKGNMQIQGRRLRSLTGELLKHLLGHQSRQRCCLARNIGQLLKTGLDSCFSLLPCQQRIILTSIKILQVFCVISHFSSPLRYPDTALLPSVVPHQDNASLGSAKTIHQVKRRPGYFLLHQ